MGAVSALAVPLLCVRVLIWALAIRSRMNGLLNVDDQPEAQLCGLWTCLFSAGYINFKLNRLNQGLDSGDATLDTYNTSLHFGQRGVGSQGPV